MWGRLYRVSLGSAFLFMLPALFIIGWYTWQAGASHLRYNLAAGDEQPLTLEVFRLHLFDALTRDFRRLTLPAPGKDELPTYALHIGNGELAQLASNLPPPEGKRNYVVGYIKKGNRVLPMKARYRGRKHWQWNYPQKSWKVRITEGNFLDGRQTLGFINTPDPLPFDEQLVLDIARENGLLTPEYFPFRLMLNNAYMGVYFYSAQADESVLRHARRMPGSIYSGDDAPVDPKTGISTLWKSIASWKKVAAKTKKSLENMAELQELIDVVNNASQVEFADYAHQHLSLDKFALLDALDVVFGSNQHDFSGNHKLYFDPYKGRFEPIAWNFRGWSHNEQFNRTENPLLLRLKEIPEYITVRNRKVFELLDKECAPDALVKRGEVLLERLKAAQTEDPYWDAYHLLPKVSRYFRQMVRPMDRQMQDAVFQSHMRVHGQRTAYLRKALADSVAQAALVRGEGPFSYTLSLTVNGVAGFALDRVVPAWTEGCRGALFVEPSCTDCDTDRKLKFYPGIRQTARPVHPGRGAVKTAPDPRTYPLTVETGDCSVTGMDVVLTNLVTGDNVSVLATLQPPVPAGTNQLTAHSSQLTAHNLRCADAAHAIAPDQTSLHPWCFPALQHRVVHLGPGDLHIKDARRFLPNEGVIIEPGTTFRMGKKASFIFEGPLYAVGSLQQPIVFRAEKKKWGGLALQGPGTAGSELKHVIIESGSTPAWGRITYSGMLNIHDTSNIKLSDVVVRDNRKGDDAVHVAYVDGLMLERVAVNNAHLDAIDLEFTQATLKRVGIFNPGDECLDLMGTDVTVEDSVLAGAGAHALSAGEETRVRLIRVLLADSKVGVLAKNSSHVTLDDSLLYRNRLGANVVVESQRYDGKSRLKMNNSFVRHCGENLLVEEGRIRKKPEMPELSPTDLAELRNSLGLSHWSGLSGWLEGRYPGGRR